MDRGETMSIYTRKGDKGKTDLIGKGVVKSHPRIHVIGLLDEVMVWLGALISRFDEQQIATDDIEYIYQQFFITQSIIADVEGRTDLKLTEEVINNLETKIDEFEKELPPLRNFIYYTGHKDAILCQQIRVKIRTVERWLVELHQKEVIEPTILAFVNRVSDYFYNLGRYLNVKNKYKERIIKL